MPRVAARDREAFVEARRAQIVDAAVRLWAARGFDGTSMAEVAAAAGLTKGTLYLYFEGKAALMEEVLRRYSLRPDIERLVHVAGEMSLEEIVHWLVRATWRRLQENRAFIFLVLRELPGQQAKARRFLSEVVLPSNRLLARILADKLPPERALRLNTLVAGRSLVGMVLLWFVSQEAFGGAELLPVDDDEAAATIAEIFLHGVLGDTATT